MSEFRVQYENRDLNVVLERLILRNTRLLPLYQEISAELFVSTKARFETETTPEGIPWDALKPATLARKRTSTKLRGQPARLYRSLRPDYSDTFASVSVGVRYAAIHQYGGTPDMAPGPAAIPARTYLGLSAEDRAEILEIALDYERDAISGL